MDKLYWHKFTKNTMPDGDCQILVMRDFGHFPFFIIVNKSGDSYTTNGYKGLTEFIPERDDRWTYIPMPEGANGNG